MASTMHISGLASGMDIDKMVSDLMKAERMPLDKLYQKKQILEWQRDDYRSMNTLLQDLDNYIFDNLTLQSSMLKKKVTSSDESAVTVTATSTAPNVTNQIKVNQIATVTTWVSKGQITINGGGKLDPDANLNTFTFATGGGSYSFSGLITLKLDVDLPDGTSKSGVTVTVDPSQDSLNDVITKINQTTDLNVSVFYDAAQQKMVFSSNKTGSSAHIKLASDASADAVNFFKALGFTDASSGNEIAQDGAGRTDGQDAKFTLNGYDMTTKENTFTINGITYTLKKADPTATINITTSTDVDAMFNAIKGFVDKYNEIIGKINAKISEERYRDYPPLTDEQKQAMTDKQIELWEEKAKSGLLRSDPILSGGLSQMRLDVYSKVSGDNINSNYDTLSEIGITTSSNYLENGKLIIDETKLREAIEKDPNAVFQLFNANGTDFNTKGIAKRLRDTIKDTIGKIEQKAGKTIWTNQQFAIGRDLNDINDQIKRFEDHLKEVEDRYWRQFTAMEEAIQRANQQSMYLMNAFGGGMQG
ncbi:flagellar hook-associated protein 2 [Geobacillus sp. 44B]|nr:flagellar hook-associated protein 2 [Geobacillus sp. 44B]